MPILKKMHYYRIKEVYKKRTKFISEIIPHKDIEVSEKMFKQFEEVKPRNIKKKEQTE